MAHNHHIRHENHGTFLDNYEGIVPVGEPWIAPNQLVLPSVDNSRMELEALKNYVKSRKSTQERPLPSPKQLERIKLDLESGCWKLPLYKDGNDVYPEGSVNAGMPRARYGRMAIREISGSNAAHRIMYIVMRGGIPELEEGVEHILTTFV